MGRNPKIKLSIKTTKQLKQLINCEWCGKLEEYGKLYFYVDDSNISITNNSKGICKTCKDGKIKNDHRIH